MNDDANFIRIKGKMVDVNQIKSFKRGEEEESSDVLDGLPGSSGLRRVVGKKVEKKTVLKLEFVDGKTETLKGSEADEVSKRLLGY